MKQLLFLLLVVSSVRAQDFSLYDSAPLNATANFQFNKANYHTYARFTENYEDSVITTLLTGKSIETYVSQVNKSLLEANKDSVVNCLLLHSFISVSNYTTQWEAIKYKKVLAKDTSAYLVLVIKYENQEIQEDSKSETGQILKNIFRLKSDAYSQLEYEKPTSEYIELVPLAKQVKDIDGTLNILKLSTYLSVQLKELEKYCDY